ncbi:helix-turn-helix domain-containing protein [Psychrobacillus vulpis]|nr:helix-turn-helix domain-containing protein [Psychrobacillus vulpis]
MVVQEYLKGNLGYLLLAQKFGIPSPTPIKHWVRAYKAFGEEGLQRKKRHEEYPVQFKLDILNFKKQTGASYQDTAIQFHMNHPALIADWNYKFLKEGIEGLMTKRGRPTTMPKKSKATQEEKMMSREEKLERENELLRLEIAYLKKLKAFRENPDVFLEKHKQRSPLNSKKKDSD